ncbi:MAG TPA: alkaline phosphatase family protein, partial [Verrucomicrobiae bacterium]|nr:alkaline phosphatase family protein [Verrucomicrobiae bacterium]
GSFHGTRGFADRNAIQLTNGFNVFYQPTGSTYELPFHTTLQCLSDLNHSWPVTHSTVNNGRDDQWIPNKKPETMCYYQRADLPYFYALADAYTICDEYHCSVLSSTFPNRFSLMTGMIDPNSTGGGPEIDNSTLPNGFRWRTYPEFLTEAGISWKVFFVTGSSSDNILPLFAAYKQAQPGSPLYNGARVGYSNLSNMVNGFVTQVASNTLPLVSWIIGPGGFTEHPPSSPANGELLLKELLDGLAANPEVYNSTVFIFNYDENDGFFDHAMPILPPPGTANEFVGSLPVGLGIRVPAIMVSPWSRGGRVCSQVFDHTSVIRFLETWTGVIDTNISAWRRQVCGDLTSAFDFAHPNTDYPILDGVDEVDCPSGQTPPVPSPQTFPVQESGARIQLPIPYQPNAACALNAAANTFSIPMTNSGAASFHFAVYPNLDSSGPWPFDVGTDASASVSFSTSGTGGDYDFTCYGPDGFQRRFAGNVTLDALKIEAVSYVNPGNAGIKIELVNSSVATVAFTVTNGYTISSGTYVVPAHSTGIISPGSESNDGYYDVTVTASADPGFVRRFMGRVETVAPGDSLVSSKNPCDVGDSVTFTFTAHGYGTPSGTVQFSANGAPTGSPEPLVNGTASFTIPSFGCDNASIAAVYSGDLFNTATTNTLLQVVSTPPPVITLNGSDPMTNWLGTPFLDPGATAENLCAEPLPVTTNQVVNSSIAGQYSVQYIAGNPGLLATNTRTVWVVQEIPPTVSAGQMLESGQFQFSFSGPATQPYRVLATTTLMDSDSWIEVASGAFGDQAAVFTETNVPAQSARFYRLVSP